MRQLSRGRAQFREHGAADTQGDSGQPHPDGINGVRRMPLEYQLHDVCRDHDESCSRGGDVLFHVSRGRQEFRGISADCDSSAGASRHHGRMFKLSFFHYDILGRPGDARQSHSASSRGW